MSESQPLLDQIAKVNAEAAKYRRRARDLRTERDALDAKVKAIETAHAELEAKLKTAASQPSEAQAEVERLRGEIRVRDHRAAFDRLAGERQVRAEAIGDLWGLSGYKAEADQPDEAAIGAAIDSALESRPWLRGTDSAKPPGGAQTGTRPAPGPGADRGKPDSTSGGALLRIREEDYSDPAFMKRNQAAIAAAVREGRRVITA